MPVIDQSSFLSKIRKESKNELGSTTVETAISIGPFLLLILALIQISILAFHALTLQYSLQRAVRWGIVGQPGGFNAIETKVFEQVEAFGLDSTGLTVSMCPETDPGCAASTTGASGQFVFLSASLPAQNYFGVGNFSVTARVLAKNEPF